MSPDVSERLDYAERWLRDGLQVLHPAVSALQSTVDMSNALRRLDDTRSALVRPTPTHLLIKACASAFANNPDLHQLVAGRTRHRPARVDIGLSISGDSFVAPVLVIEGADSKSIDEIAAETTSRARDVRQQDRALLDTVRRWGWLVPFGFLRRAVLRRLFSSPGFRLKGTGVFQVSPVPADWAFSGTFASVGVLFAGQVRPRVVVVEGAPAVRPVMILTLCADHGIWDGRASARFLSAVAAELEREHPAGVVYVERAALPDGSAALNSVER